ESADTASIADNLQAAVDDGYDLIVANSFESADAVTALAAANPNQKIAIVDTTPTSPEPDVLSLLFKEHEGSFLLGATIVLLATGVDTDQRSLDPDHILESMVKRTDVGVHDAVCDLAHGTWAPGIKAYGLAENGVGPAFLVLPDSPPASRIPQAVQDQVKSLA